MYSNTWVNQFEIIESCIEFVVNNVSEHGNNYVKIKLKLKVGKIWGDCSPNSFVK